MTRTRDFDYGPLTRSGGLGARLTAASSNNLMVMGGTVGALLVIVPAVVFVGLIASGNASDVGGLTVLGMLFGGGIYVLTDVLRRSGGAVAFGGFARANDLTLVRGSTVPHYAGSLFADQSHAVYQSVRTRDDAFIEVGERIPTSVPRGARRPNRPALFLRARLAGRANRAPHLGEIVPPELHDALGRFAGAYAIEVSGDELTLFGSQELGAERRGRVQEAFAITDELVTRANAALVPPSRPGGSAAGAGPTRSGIPIPAPTRLPAPKGSPQGPLSIIGWALALLIGGPLAIAIVMSILDDQLREEHVAARLVVSLIVIAAGALVARVGKAAMTPRHADKRSSPG